MHQPIVEDSMTRSIVPWIIVVLTTVHPNQAKAQIYISGPLHGTLPDTTYIVQGDISVDSTDTLSIEPGAVFLFDGNFDFEIYGYLHAVGTEMDSILFRQNPGADPWGSIIFRTGSSHDSELSYAFITGAGGSAINAYDVDITISHCSIISNNANWGGGIYFRGASGTISDCVVDDNQSVNNGGGIYCTTGAHATIENCVVTNNRSNIGGTGSGRGGGGICANHSASPTITNCTITGNYCAENGGGISINDQSHPEIIDCIISDNSADSSGGGIFCSSNCDPVITNCDIDDNQAQDDGGGICLITNANAIMDNCMLQGNSADSSGGGIYCNTNCRPTIFDCFLEGNSAVFNGGGICLIDSSDAIIDSCMLFFNGCLGNGGGLYVLSSEPQLTRSELARNESTEGGGLWVQEGGPISITHCDINANTATGDGGGIYANTSFPQILNSIVWVNNGNGGIFFHSADSASVSYSDFFGNEISPFTGDPLPYLGQIVTVNANGDSCDQFYNIFLDPEFRDPWLLDYALTEGSPCINAGDPESPLDPDSTVADIGSQYYEILDAQQSRLPELPGEFVTVSTYPNPFNVSTVFSYQLSVVSFVNLPVYDVRGRKVAELVNGWREAGVHEVTFDGTDLASGVYIYQLHAGEKIVSGKMVLLK
jgi:parallel beta-helix repeat protein/predicted outer membrane repeat protein